MDLPARIVAAATRFLPGDRQEWGAAMTAELAQLRGRPDRWRFALGCVRAAFLAPLPPNSGAPGVAVTVTFLVGVASCLAVTAYVLATWPHTVDEITQWTAGSFIACLAAYFWIGLRPPRALVAHRAAARRGAAIGFALVLFVGVGRSIIDYVVPPDGDLTVGLFLTVTVVGTLVTTAFRAARTAGSFGAGVTASLWVGLTCSIIAFNASLIAILVGFNLDAHMRHVMPDYYTAFTPDAFMSRHIGDHLTTSMGGLYRVPALGLFFGIVGAAIGRIARGTPVVPPEPIPR